MCTRTQRETDTPACCEVDVVAVKSVIPRVKPRAQLPKGRYHPPLHTTEAETMSSKLLSAKKKSTRGERET